MGLDLAAIQRPTGAIKILLVLLAIIAFGTVVDYKTECPRQNGHHIDYKGIPHSEFFVAVYVLLFLIESALLGMYVFAMEVLMSVSINWWLIELIYSAFWSFMMLLASCLLSDGVDYVEDWYIKQPVKADDCQYTGWKFGVAVGFIAFFVMLGKSWYTYKELRDSGMTSTAGEYTPLNDDNGDPGEVTVSV
mmetsp:Transcript_21615/g.56373  ORF Transcript_21615/g.56373 Transcript_21615/m.56373 type:complete len:191 (-) Transcript_21615:137-709(-)